MGWWGDIKEDFEEAVSNVGDAGQNLVEGIGQAGHDLITSIDDTAEILIEGTWDVVITQTDDFLKKMFSDLWGALLDIGDQIIEGLTKMFEEPAFWLWVVSVLEVVFLGQGLQAAMAAEEGKKAAAFFSTSGIHYQGASMKWLSSAHQITYTVSQEYREHFQEIWGDFAADMEKFGVDLQGYARILGDGMAIWNASRAMIGMEPAEIEESWAGKLEEVMSETGDTLEKWGDDPNAMVEWFNEHIYLPANSAMAEWSNRISSAIDTFAERTDQFANDLGDFTGAFGDLAEHWDKQFGTNYTEDWAEGNRRIEEMILEPWEHINDRLEDVADAFEARIFKAEQADAEQAIAEADAIGLGNVATNRMTISILERIS